MKWRMLVRADDPEAVSAALQSASVRHKIDAVRLDQESKPGAQDQAVAVAIFQGLQDGDTYGRVAKRVGVSYHTVMRLAKNPRKYGIDADPIRRRGQHGADGGTLG